MKAIGARIDKTNYYLDIAETVAERSTCLKRHYGAIIVKNDSIIATGFNGAPRGIKDCLECNQCNRQNSERGMDYSNCLAVHAEQNAIISASREEMLGSTLYLVGYEETRRLVTTKPDFITEDVAKEVYPVEIEVLKEYVKNAEPCSLCKRMIINAGIKEVVIRLYKKDIGCEYGVRHIPISSWNKNDLIGGY